MIGRPRQGQGCKIPLESNGTEGSFAHVSSYREKMGARTLIQLSCELTKLHLSLYIALSAILGHVLAQNTVTLKTVIVGTGVLFLSCGAALVNNIQDREFDTWFYRTRGRALVQNRIPLSAALLAAIALTCIGLCILFTGLDGIISFVLGLLSLVFYNGIYTPLKKYSLAAIIPGTICGMLPVAIGWSGVPNELVSKDLSCLWIAMAVLGVWQIPHFFIILIKHLPDCPSDSPGSVSPPYPSFFNFFNPVQVCTQIQIWTCLFSLGLVLFLLHGGVGSSILAFILFAAALFLPLFTTAVLCLRPCTGRQIIPCFLAVNFSMLLFMGISILDRF